MPAFLRKDFKSVNNSAAIKADYRGQTTQVDKILYREERSVYESLNRFHPMIEPMIAWLVETGSPNFVIQYTVNPAARAAINEPPRAFTAPSLPNVREVPVPLIIAPRITKIPQISAAVVNRTIRLPTAVPKTFAASFAPSDQPRNRPPVKKIIIVGSITISYFRKIIIYISMLLDHK